MSEGDAGDIEVTRTLDSEKIHLTFVSLGHTFLQAAVNVCVTPELRDIWEGEGAISCF